MTGTGKHTPLGKQIIDGLDELIEALDGGGMAAVEKKFTVRRVIGTQFAVPPLGRSEVNRLRDALGVSQPVFASLLGVSPSLVKAWEQGLKVPNGVALRFLTEIKRNVNYWKGYVSAASRAV